MCAKKCKAEQCNPEKCKNNSCGSKQQATQTVATKAKLTMPMSAAAAAGMSLAAGLQPEQQLETITDPAEAIMTRGVEFHKLYKQYEILRDLARPLNGLPQTANLPDNVKVLKVAITFSVDGNEQTTEIPGANFVGEVAGLIGNGLRNLIERMYQNLFTLGHVAESMQKAVQQAIPTRGTSSVTLETKADEKTV